MTPDLVAFLRQRLAEDEREVQDVLDAMVPLSEFAPTYGLAAFFSGSSTFPARDWSWDPTRVLTEIEAKRAILDNYAAVVEIRATASAALTAAQQEGRVDRAAIEYERDYYRTGIELAAMGDTLLSLAQPYKGQPGWWPGWEAEG